MKYHFKGKATGISACLRKADATARAHAKKAGIALERVGTNFSKDWLHVYADVDGTRMEYCRFARAFQGEGADAISVVSSKLERSS